MSEENKRLTFRPLKASEIELRASTVKVNGYGLLLYKDARCDMRILDEELGVLGWKREHQELKGSIYCGVSIKKDDEWIIKWDAGAESYTEKVKGEASDSFKRACFNWGLGRELYTSPFIWITNSKDIANKGTKEKPKYYLKFNIGLRVKEIKYNDQKEIIKLKIVGKDNVVRFLFGYDKGEEQSEMPIGQTMIDAIVKLLDNDMDLSQKYLDKYNIKAFAELDMIQGTQVYKHLKSSK